MEAIQSRANRRRKQQGPFMGCSKIGQIQTSKAHLVSCLGEPTVCNSHIPGGFYRQTLYRWEFLTPVGPLAIYDYKEWDDPDFADDKVICWSVSGRVRSYRNRPIHPVNKWVAEQTRLTVTDERPACWLKPGPLRGGWPS